MDAEETRRARARFVRAILAWHDHRHSDLAQLLGITVAAVYKKLDGRLGFTTDQLVIIADRYGVDPGLLLRPDPSVLAPALGLLTST